MTLNTVSIMFNDDEEGHVKNVKYMDFDDATLTINCTHGVDISIPMENISSISVERRLSVGAFAACTSLALEGGDEDEN